MTQNVLFWLKCKMCYDNSHVIAEEVGHKVTDISHYIALAYGWKVDHQLCWSQKKYRLLRFHEPCTRTSTLDDSPYNEVKWAC
jgi:hypothetical protein